MRVTILLPQLLILLRTTALAFVSPNHRPARPLFAATSRLSAESSPSKSSSKTSTSSTSSSTAEKTLGLLTFDLDDTLYPIAPVLEGANTAFANALERFGYKDIRPDEIVQVAKQIRSEIAATDAERAATITHTEVRLMAIRQVLEKRILKKKLQETAEDWATEVEFLGRVVVESAKKWAKAAVPESIVQAVYTAWEMERYHSAERLLYPEVLDVLSKIREQHPNLIIGAVTDGRANPLLMTFTLAPYFDFCLSWEDDQGSRSKFFKDLQEVKDTTADLNWIYNAAREKYYELKDASDAVDAAAAAENEQIFSIDNPDDKLWIHVGDDLAYDVAGSAGCGAKTVLVELIDSYGQTARLRFDPSQKIPEWSTASKEELENHARMNEAAIPLVNKKINRLTQLPDAINSILEEAAAE